MEIHLRSKFSAANNATRSLINFCGKQYVKERLGTPNADQGAWGKMFVLLTNKELFESDTGCWSILLFFNPFCQLADGDAKRVDVAPDIFRQVVDGSQVFFLLDLKKIHPGPEFSQFCRYRRCGQ